MTVSLRSRILSAILYADFFHYPLTLRELQTWIPTDKPIVGVNSKKRIIEIIKKSPFIYNPPFIYISPHKKNITHRINRHIASIKKWKYIYRVGKFLRYIPSIQLVGVTGGLAMNNADEKDDIDLLIITKDNTMWMTRLLVTILIEIVAKRRRPGDSEVKNAICLNMFLTESTMNIPINEQGWYTAHELLQMTPLWQRSNTYKKLLTVNSWAKSWFWYQYKMVSKKRIFTVNDVHLGQLKLFLFLEPYVKTIQLWYMKKRRTIEVVSDAVIRFHPHDARIWIRKTFIKNLQAYKIPLDKNHNQI